MNTGSPELSGIVGSSSFASADFPDAAEVSLYDYSMASEANYSTVVNNAVIKHYSEIKDKQESIAESLTNSWKRKSRDFLMTKNKTILEFLSSKLKTHPVFGKTEHFINTFGKKNLNFNQQSIREICFDVSSSSILDEYNAVCISKELLPFDKYIEQTKYIIDEYKLVAEKIIDKQDLLKRKLDLLDLVQTKLKNIVVLNENDHYDELMEVSHKYFSRVYDDNLIEEDYNDLMNEYKKYVHLRELLKTVRAVDISEKEPLCSICFNESVQYAFVPCGHTFCNTCIRRQSLNCGICRTTIRDRVKLFFT
jgi:hypothetical protein